MPHQHEIGAAVRAGLLDRQQVGGRLDDAELTAVTLIAAAEAANRLLGEHPTALAVADRAHGSLQHGCEAAARLPILVEQMERHSLRGLRSNAREALERLDELVQERGVNVGHVARTGA